MTGPRYTVGGIEFQDNSVTVDQAREAEDRVSGPVSSFPAPILNGLSDETLDGLRIWLDDWIFELEQELDSKLTQFAREEKNYRITTSGPKSFPFEGASGEVVPLIAMAVDPIFARLDVSLFKTDRIMQLKALKRSYVDYIDVLERFIDFYLRHKVQLRREFQPRCLDFVKHGTMVFKSVYDDDTRDIVTYDQEWKPVKKKVTTFRGPRIVGVPLNRFMYPARYQYVQDAPCIAEKHKMTIDKLRLMEAAKKIENVDKIKNQEHDDTDVVEQEQERSANHERMNRTRDITVYELWCDYDINGDGLPERLAIIYHKETRTFLQLRYNWYFHQRKPYVVIPYQITSGSIYGIGLCAMIEPFQDSATTWQQHASNNAYLANIRMFIAKKDAGIEDSPRLYSGRVFHVDNPREDFIPFAAADIYNSTLQERQNVMGLVEKRTGVSDYLTGRESPIVGSRATATSTLALIKEGTQRVEEVNENIRYGLAELVYNSLFLWFQYGLDGLDDILFSDDDLTKLKDFFDNVNADNLHGAIAVDIAATDAANNQTIKQQTQMALIQVMMSFYEKIITVGRLALEAAPTMPQYSEMVVEVMTAAKKMFRELLQAYDIRNPDDYLPMLEEHITNAMAALQSQQGTPGGPGDISGGAPSAQGIPGPGGAAPGSSVSVPATAGGGNGASGGLPFAG